MTRWLQKYRAGGLGELLKIKKAPVAKPKIPEAVIARLEEELKKEVGFRSYGAIVEWLKTEYGLDVSDGTVYALVRYKLAAKLKVPRPQSYKHKVELLFCRHDIKCFSTSSDQAQMVPESGFVSCQNLCGVG